MKKFKKALIVLGILTFVMIALNGINILQAGSKESDGRSMAQIMGVNPQTATYDDVEKLSRKDKMQLFYAAKTPDFKAFNGEYEARLLSGGILGGSSAMFTHYVFPTGLPTLNTQWVGKAFIGKGKDSGQGYNIFTEKNSDTETKTLRIRQMRTSMGASKVGKNGKQSFLVDYSADNSGGSINPAPFALIGPAKPWVGPDAQ